VRIDTSSVTQSLARNCQSADRAAGCHDPLVRDHQRSVSFAVFKAAQQFGQQLGADATGVTLNDADKGLPATHSVRRYGRSNIAGEKALSTFKKNTVQ